MRRTLLTLVAIALLLSACSSSSGSDGEGTSTTAPASTTTSAAGSTTAAPTTTAPAVTATSAATTSTTAPALKANLAVFAGTWIGHTRTLKISGAGAATETVGDGCCDPVIDLAFALSNPTPTAGGATTATATVTSVAVHAGWDPATFGPAPTVGQTGTVTLDHGVITSSLSGGNTYCGDEAPAGTCGA